ncbi:MAG TPA: Uma2 family endonuclease, partial [Gemmataceae bacterium]|nr:Uma2 family endonuclease [Gemmataceae bacterium]
GDTPSAESEMAEKRADYFQAGTEVVWDVDPLAECIHVYRASDPDRPLTFRRGQTVDAEPAVPGWRVDVDWIFGETLSLDGLFSTSDFTPILRLSHFNSSDRTDRSARPSFRIGDPLRAVDLNGR